MNYFGSTVIEIHTVLNLAVCLFSKLQTAVFVSICFKISCGVLSHYELFYPPFHDNDNLYQEFYTVSLGFTFLQ